MRSRLFALSLTLASLAPVQQGARGPYRGGMVTPPLPKPSFVLRDTSGAPFDFRNRTQGSVTLLFFGYTNCPDQCPMHMANIGMALKDLPSDVADQIKLVFVTTDPARDTAAVLRRWLDNFDRHFVGVTGTQAALEMIQKTAGVPVAQKSDASNGRYSVAHANFVLAYTKDNLAHVIYPGGVGKDDWVHDLRLLAQESWAHR